MTAAARRFIGLVGIVGLLLAGSPVHGQDFRITAEVHEDVCTSPASQCVGFPTAPALAGNDQPVLITLQVSAKEEVDIGDTSIEAWVPVSDLPGSLFQVDTPFFAPGGAPVKKRTCGGCFQSTGGTYQIWVEPVDGANWLTGIYTLRIGIPVGADTLIFPTLVHMTIPPSSMS